MTGSRSLRSLKSIAFAGALATVAACSNPSGLDSINPIGPSGSSGSSGGVFFPRPNTDPCATDPYAPECQISEGRFTGGGFQVNASGIKVTRGFTLHCDEILSNNLEVNWDGGNNFHIDKNPNVVACFKAADPAPPNAPVNTIAIQGPGTLNGVPGVMATVVLVDTGERKNAPPDRAYIEIGGVNLTGGTPQVPPIINGGNIQAHFDQPHK